MSNLEEIEAIKQLKYKYFRCVDKRLWDELAECLTADAVARYSGGKYAFNGRDQIIGFLKKGMTQTLLTMHHGHHPEIKLTGPNTARGIWALEDYVIDLTRNTTLHGAAFYEDEYVKVNGEWKIKSTGYDRTFEEFWQRGDIPSLKVTANMFAPRTKPA